MDFQFDEVQQGIRHMVKAFVDREVRPVAMEYELEDRYPAPIVEKMRELGFFGFTIPEQYGGSGLDEVCYAILMEELSVGWMSGLDHRIGHFASMRLQKNERLTPNKG